jgi:hypothetical protein
MLLTMKTLRNNFNVSLLLLFLTMSLFNSFVSIESSVQPNIDKEIVRKDIILHRNYIFPEKFIKYRDTSYFKAFYINDYCFVHIPYSNSDTRSYEPISAISIYLLKNNKWIYQNTIPYYFEMSLLSSKNKIFLSDNIFCGANMACNCYCEISQFIGDSLKPILHYSGFNEEVYLDGLLVKGDINEVLNSKGDTIENVVKLSDFIFDDNGLKSYMLERKIGILTGVEKDMNDYDSLVTKQLIIKERIEYNSVDWDLN